MTQGWSHPSGTPRLIATSSDPMPIASRRLPTTSKVWSSRRSVAGRTNHASATATAMPEPWITNSTRQLVASISGPPTATPIAGAAASTALHVPATRVRRSSGNTDIMMASADGPVDAAKPCAMTRTAINMNAEVANDVRSENTAAPANPMRYMRRCP